MAQSTLPVVVIGAGPVGLAAAANLHKRNIPFLVFELGDVGSSIRDWGHVQLFSPWRFNTDPASVRLLEAAGWDAPEGTRYPTGADLVDRYLAPLASLPAIAPHVRTNRLVTSVTRAGVDKARTHGRDDAPFLVTTDGPHGIERVLASAVIDASGTWRSPNPLGADGTPALGERVAADHIEHGIPDVLERDRARYRSRRVAVVGSGHSAQNVVRDLTRLAARYEDTEVTWVLRRSETGQMFGGKANDQLPERGRLGAEAHAAVDDGPVRLEPGFRIDEIATTDDGVVLLSEDGRKLGPFDRIIAATGFRPDLEPLRELRIDVDPSLESARALGPLIDPNVHSCGSVPPHGATDLAHPEPGFYVVGVKSYGRAPTFLLATGYEQVRSVVAAIAGDHVSAAEVHLALPETGVCAADRSPVAPSAGADVSVCCG